DERRELFPLGAGRGDELVDDDLRSVGEIAELRLPQRQRAGRVNAVAVLKAQRAAFAQRAVVDRERRLRLPEMLERDVQRAGLLIVQHGMAMAEGAAFRILPRQAYGRPIR